MEKSKFLDIFQAGFRKNHNTPSALIKLTDEVSMGKENKLATLLLQFDFSKAFDNVSPSKLLRKLQDASFSKSSLHWFWSYLCGQSVRVVSKTSISDYRNTNIGVLQGSVLSPLLSCIYMNDLKDCPDENTFRLLYSNDLQIYVQVPANQTQQGISMLTESAKIVASWAK